MSQQQGLEDRQPEILVSEAPTGQRRCVTVLFGNAVFQPEPSKFTLPVARVARAPRHNG
jgi:hypothetical protein